MTKILVEVDERVLAHAAARLGTTTEDETVGAALKLAANGSEDVQREAREWAVWADKLGNRLGDVDWDAAWRSSPRT